MDAIVKKVLNKIVDAGFDAYLVGGYVRDYLIGIKSMDVDICTNALPKDLHKIFPINNNANLYGGFNLKIKNFNIDITTFRKELKYEKRKPVEIVYIDKLEEDIKRRDFTINSICMDKNEKVIDLVGGVNDLNKHLIRMNGDIEKKIIDDPLRILRAIRFASRLNFHLDDDLKRIIKDNHHLVSKLSNMRIKEELSKILLNSNYQVGLNLLRELNLLNDLQIDFEEVVYVNDICGMWAQLKINKNYAFTKQENRNIISIRHIIDDGNINYYTLYKYGLYNTQVAGEILGVDKKIINKMVKKMPLESIKDLQITSEEILNLLNCPKEDLSKIKNKVVSAILDGKINNNRKAIKKYLISIN